MTDTAQISITRDGDTAIITGGGSLDLTNYQDLADGLRSAATEAKSILVDLREAKFIDTAVVQDLAKAAVAMLDKGKRLKVLVNETAYPYRVLQISGFQDIMDIDVGPSEEQQEHE